MHPSREQDKQHGLLNPWWPVTVITIGLLAFAVAFATASCAKNDATVPPGTGSAPAPSTQDPGSTPSLKGLLKPTVEAGGWLLVTDSGTEYLLLLIQDYGNQEWLRAGQRVSVWGKADPGAITTYMQGTPFRVDRMEPSSNGSHRQ